MSDTEIETTIRRLLLYKKNLNSKESENHLSDIQNNLIKICVKFHFFIKKVLTNKNTQARKMMSDILNHIEFINVQEKEIIWNIGDRVNEMYIIFLGEVNIYKQPKKKDITEPELECTLENGYSLGEEFLKNNVLRRTYMAEAKTFCILGKLPSKEYLRIFNKLLYDENILILNFLKDLNMFTYDYIDRFQRCVSLKYYNKNEYIFKQNQPFNTFYFIFSGRVGLTATLKKFVKSKIDHDILLGKNNNQRFTTSRLFEIKGFYTESINYNIVDLTNSDIIGGIEYLNHFNNYKYSVKCLTDVEVLKVDLVHFNEILMSEEMKLFNKKLEKQTEFISRRIKEIKEEREKIQVKDYITSKNKFTKTFLWNNPISKKMDLKSEIYINSGSNPIKIMKHKYNRKKLKNTKILLNSIDDYKTIKNFRFKNAKSYNHIKGIKNLNFLTSIDNNKRTPVGQIFPTFSSQESIPQNKRKKIVFINSKYNTNYTSKSNNNNNNSIHRTIIKNRKKMKSAVFKNKVFNSISNFSPKKKNSLLNVKTSSYKNVKIKSINKNENNCHNHDIIFNNENIREKFVSYLNDKKNNNINSKSNKCISNINSFRNNNKFNTFHSE